MIIEPLNRRQVLQGIAIGTAGGALVAACGPAPTTTTEDPDLKTLNALLTAEYNAVQAYTAGAGVLMAPPAGDPMASLAPTLLQVAVRFQAQHKDHAATIKATIEALKGKPVDEASVTYTVPSTFTASVLNVLKLACNAEKAATIAYNGAVKGMKAADNRFLAAIIEGDESQHFIILYLLIKGLAAPGSALSTATVKEFAPTAFVSSRGSDAGLQSYADFNVTD